MLFSSIRMFGTRIVVLLRLPLHMRRPVAGTRLAPLPMGGREAALERHVIELSADMVRRLRETASHRVDAPLDLN